MHLFQLEIITINYNAFYITKNYDVNSTRKKGNILFLKQHILFPLENENTSILPRNAYGSPNFDKVACTNCCKSFLKISAVR